MKISLQWLADFLPGPSDAERFADALTSGGLPVEAIERHGDDTVMDVEVTSNRGDCLSHLGVARELAALLDRPFRNIHIELAEASDPAGSLTSVQIENVSLCPYYSARIICGVKVGPSPAWMACRLEAAGVRSINNIVDATNYVMLALGQPLHAFDFDRLGGRRIVVRNPRDGETLLTLDGHNRKLTSDMLVIADASRPVALAGVMGGRDTEVSAATTNVLLESARFDPLAVRRMSRALGIKSEASYRFERGIDPELPPRASEHCAQLIRQVAGGDVLAGAAESGSARVEPKLLSLRLSKLRHVLGIDTSPEEAAGALRRLGLNPTLKSGQIDCLIPSFRADLNIEVDLVEEVARVLGYDRIPVRETISIQLTAPAPDRKVEERIRQTLVACGFFEAVTFSFATDGLAELFAPPGVRLCQADPMARKADSKLRPSILPGLLEAVNRNEAVGIDGARLFEIGSTYWHNPDGSIDERRRVGIVGAADYRVLRGAVEAILSTLEARKSVEVTPGTAPGFAPGATGTILWDGQPVGLIGAIDQSVVQLLDLRETVSAAELELPPLIAGTQHVPQLQPIPRFPAVRRDLSLVLAERTPFAAVKQVVADQKLPWLESMEFVTTYRGKPLQKGQKSVTIALVFRSPAETLTGGQVDAAVESVVNAAREKLGATLRM